MYLNHSITVVEHIFQNLYDRVAGDDIDTGDEIEALECCPQELNSQHSLNSTANKSSEENLRDGKTFRDIKIEKSNEGHRIKSPIPVARPNRTPLDSPIEVEEEKVVMRIAPRPPIRKRPKSTPVLDHVSNQLSQMMEDKMR